MLISVVEFILFLKMNCALDDGNGNVKIEQMCIQNISMFDIGDKFEYAEMPSVSG